MAGGLSALNPIDIGPRSKIGDLVLDALLREEEKLANKVAQFPAEDGFDFTDHVVREPRRLTFQGFVSNSPIKSHGGPLDAQARATIPVLDHVVGPNLNFAELALRYLYQIREDAKLVTVVTPRGTFANLQLEEITRIKVRETGDALDFTAQFVQTRMVTVQVAIVIAKNTGSSRSQPVQDAGKKTPAPAKPEDVSILMKGLNGLGLFTGGN